MFNQDCCFFASAYIVASFPARQDRRVDPEGNRTHKAREYLALPRLERVELTGLIEEIVEEHMPVYADVHPMQQALDWCIKRRIILSDVSDLCCVVLCVLCCAAV